MSEEAGRDTGQLQIDVVSDVMCPWCYIGQKRLDKAMATLPNVPVEIRWRPFQLDPTLPPGGKDRKTYLSEKFGGEEKAQSIYANIKTAGDAEDIEFDFDAIAVSPNTLDAHRLIRWAGALGPEVQDKVVRRLFALFFEQGVDIGQHTVLLDIARDCGMDVSIVESLLATDADVEAVKSEIATANRMGINGVPCFIIDNKYAVMGAQDPSALADAIRKVSEAKLSGETP